MIRPLDIPARREKDVMDLVKIVIPADIERGVPAGAGAHRCLVVNLGAQRQMFPQIALKFPAKTEEVAVMIARVVPETAAAERRPFLVLAESLLKPERGEKLRVP